MWWLIFPGLLLVLIIILVVRAILFKPYTITEPVKNDFELDNEGIMHRFSELIKCKTISDRDTVKVNFAEFEKMRLRKSA